MFNYPSDFDTARVIRDAQNGSMVAKVALMAVMGEGLDWPDEFRRTAGRGVHAALAAPATQS